jgi:hypothetical protein
MEVLPGWGGCLIVIAAALCPGIAAGATIEDAQRIVERAEPLQCEVYAWERRLQASAAGTGEHAKVAAGLDQARARLKAYYMATMTEYIEVMKTLTFEERKRVYAYSSAVVDRCAAKAGI